MFGFCAFNKFKAKILPFFLVVGIPAFSLVAQAQAQKATIINDQAMIYQDSDFDSMVIGTVARGKVYDVSTAQRNGFHKIRLKPGTVGWIADTDLRAGVHKIAEAPKKDKPKKKRRQRSFDLQSYRGGALEMVQFQENTLGDKRKESLLFYGFKFAGANTLFDGDIVTDASLMFHFGAPNYYRDLTNNEAKGWLFLANFLFQTVQPQGKDVITFYGFGPTFRYSHFDVALTRQGKQLNYSADDMTLGAVFDAGIGLRLSDYALRSDIRYYWEKESYLGLGVSFLASF